MSDPVLDLLEKQNISYTLSGKDYLIKCLNKDHEDTSPSFRVDKITGVSHCFSCGFKTNIFSHFNISNNFVSIKVAKLRDKLHSVAQMSKDLEFPCETEPYTKKYRGISAKTIEQFGAFYTYVEEKYSDRLFFPIKDLSGKTSVFIGRAMHTEASPRYMMVPSGTKVPLYPVVFKNKYTSVVFVEGIFDMLNLYDKGVENVCCTFGTSTLFKDVAQKVLPLKAQGIYKIYLCFDGDKAGKDAMDKIQPLLEELGFFVEQITLPDSTDPGELSQEHVDTIRNYIA